MVAISPWELAADLLDPPNDYLTDPKQWVTDKLNEFLWSKQIEIMEAVRDHRRVAVHSCHESGKSFTASRVVTWWLDAHVPGEAFAVTTAPRGDQVKAILWREINRAHKKGQLFGRCNQTEWLIGNELVAFGRKPADTDTESFQGIHSRYVLVVLDEANGIPKGLWDAAETLIANEGGRILAIGNPDDPSSQFAEVCKPGSGWRVIHIGAASTPNFTGEYVPADVSAGLIHPLWAKERAVAWGKESPLYISKVEGRFPPYATDTVAPYQYVQACRELEFPDGDEPPQIDLGLDPGAGGDQTSIRERRGMVAGRVWHDHSADPSAVVGLTMQAIRETRATRVKVDTIGIGWGIAGWLATQCADAYADAEDPMDWEVEIVAVNVSERPSDPSRFTNLRDEIWWEVGRELSRLKRWDLHLVDDDTVAQLVAPKYGISANGLTKVEKKDEVRKRLGRSPDDADALLLAFYEPPVQYWGAV